MFLFGNKRIRSLFGKWELNLVLILDDGSISITSDDTRIVHKIGAIEPL